MKGRKEMQIMKKLNEQAENSTKETKKLINYLLDEQRKE